MVDNIVSFPKRTMTGEEVAETLGAPAHVVVQEVGEMGGSAVASDVRMAQALIGLSMRPSETQAEG